MSPKNNHILIIGTGFAGICMGIRLKTAGIHDFTILEQAGQVGGTWRDNHYPGAACDVQSHLYAFSFEPNPGWSRMFAEQPEILAYMNHCVDKYGLRPYIRFNSEVIGATFHEHSGLWDVETSTGKTLRVRAVISGTGGLSRPSYPNIPGLDTFQGKAFHSARWDNDYPLKGKTVAVIGTGASAIQIVPAIAPNVGRLHVFQRTPPWILPKTDRTITPFEQRLFRHAPLAQKLAREAIYWMLERRALAFVWNPRLMTMPQRDARDFLAASVPDPILRAKLTPTYTLGCKRVLISDDYYPALQRPHVELVADGIEEIRAHSIVTKDRQVRPVDALVLATGFQVAEAVAPFAVRGRGGRELTTAWRNGAEAYLGTTVSGFPNFFFLLGPNTGLGHSSILFMIESQAEYILRCIQTMRASQLKLVDVRPDVQSRYNAELKERLDQSIWATGGCTSWYTTSTGKNTTLWPGFTFEFRARTRRFDAIAYELVPDDQAPSPVERLSPTAPAATASAESRPSI